MVKGYSVLPSFGMMVVTAVLWMAPYDVYASEIGLLQVWPHSVEVNAEGNVLMWLQADQAHQLIAVPTDIRGPSAQRLLQGWAKFTSSGATELPASVLESVVGNTHTQVGQIQWLYHEQQGLVAHVRLHHLQHAWQSPILLEDGFLLAKAHGLPLVVSTQAWQYARHRWQQHQRQMLNKRRDIAL